MKYVKVISVAVLVTLSLLTIIYLASTKSISSFEYNGYSFQYDSSKFNLIQSNNIDTKDYISGTGSINYSEGSFYFSVNGNKIIYSLKDKELPPSNSLNDIYPIRKKGADLQLKFDANEEIYGFMFVICTKDEVIEEFKCVPGSDKLVTSYNYGQIPTSDYYFEKMVDVLGMKWSRLSLSFEDGHIPTQSDIDDFLSFHYLVSTAKKIDKSNPL